MEISLSTRRFAQGTVAGEEVRKAHCNTTFESFEQRLSFFWFYVGALATSRYGCTEQEDFEPFLLGAAQHQPTHPAGSPR